MSIRAKPKPPRPPRIAVSPDTQPLSDTEMTRIIRKYRYSNFVAKSIGLNRVRMLDIAEICHVNRERLFEIVQGAPLSYKKQKLGPKVKARISRVLRMLEAGLIERKDGVLIFHDAPTKKPETIHRVSFLMTGRPRLIMGAPAAPLPSFSGLFALSPLTRDR